MGIPLEQIAPGSNASPRIWCLACLMAAIGGILPTACKLGATYVSHPETPLPSMGLFVGLLIFAVIGVVLCIAFRQTELHRALIIGIAAPGLITNIVSGAAAATLSPDGEGVKAQSAIGLPIGFTENGIARPPTSSRGKGHFFLAEGPRQVRIDSLVTNDISIRGRIDVSVKVRGALQPRPVGSLPARGAISVNLPRNAKRLIFTAAGKRTEVAIPRGAFDVQLHVYAASSWKKDFRWALGGRRYGTINSIAAQIVRPTLGGG